MYDIAIVGSGPAGASAAIFCAKANKHTVVIDNNLSVTRRAYIANHYGAPEITGPDLVDRGKRQAEQLGAEFVTAAAKRIVPGSGGLDIETDQGTLSAGQVIIASGLYTELAENSGLKTRPGTEPRIKTILVIDEQGRTSMEGVWAAGTIAGVSMHTIITAGDGARVAVNVISALNGERWVDHDVLKRDT